MRVTAAIFAALLALILVTHSHAAESSAKTQAKPEKGKTGSAKPPTSLQITEVKAGAGKVAEKNKRIKVHYTGWLWDAGKSDLKGQQFDSSKGRDPLEFKLGAGQVIQGWDEGFSNMKVGGQRRLVIPADMAYGKRGAGDVIPPDSTLVFDIELVDVL